MARVPYSEVRKRFESVLKRQRSHYTGVTAVENDVMLEIDRAILRFLDPFDKGIETAAAVKFVEALKAEMLSQTAPQSGYTRGSIRALVDRAHRSVTAGIGASPDATAQLEAAVYRVLADVFRRGT